MPAPLATLFMLMPQAPSTLYSCRALFNSARRVLAFASSRFDSVAGLAAMRMKSVLAFTFNIDLD